MKIENSSTQVEQSPRIDAIPVEQESPVVNEARAAFKESIDQGDLLILETVDFDKNSYPVIIGKAYESECNLAQKKLFAEKFKKIVKNTYEGFKNKEGVMLSKVFAPILGETIRTLKSEKNQESAIRIAGALASVPIEEVIKELLQK